MELTFNNALENYKHRPTFWFNLLPAITYSRLTNAPRNRRAHMVCLKWLFWEIRLVKKQNLK